MKRVYLFDLSVLAHKANAIKQGDKIKRPRGWLSEWIKANLASICSLTWDLERETSDTPIICFLVDSKPYWRSVELKKIGIAYKKGRKSRTRKGLSYLKSLLIKEIVTLGLPVLGLPGQEADDMASMFVRSKPSDVAIRLVTTDNDWCGLINHRVDWYCMHGYQPRYRATVEDLQKSRQGEESGITDLKDFYLLKQKIGDAGDNVPPDSVPWATDILNPLTEYDPFLTKEGYKLWSDFYKSLDTYAQVTEKLGRLGPKYTRWLLVNGAKKIVS